MNQRQLIDFTSKVIRNYLIVGCLIYLILIGVPLWDGFFYSFWKYYHHPLLLYFPIFIVIETLFQTIPIIFHRRQKLDYYRYCNADNIALIIPCHNSASVIGTTLQSALQIFDKKVIFVVDNGSNPNPTDNTPEICHNLGVNYQYIPIPHKLSALYAGVCTAHNFDKILQIDDDILLPKNIDLNMDEDIDCLGYTIGATNMFNDQLKLIHRFQDLEYKSAGIKKGFEAKTGSVLFPHGAVALWRYNVLQNVLNNHPMYPMSDDWFCGYIANRLGYRIGFRDTIFIQTDACDTYFGFGNNRTTGYGSNSLWNQRFSRWHRLNILQCWYHLIRVIFYWKFKKGILRELTFKLECCWIMLYTGLIIVRIPFLIYNFYFAPIWTGYMYALDYAINMFNILMLNYYHLNGNERQPLWILPLFQLYRLYNILVMMLACIYSIFFYLPIMLACTFDKPKIVNNKPNYGSTNILV